jgi:hypothetical protein
MSEPNESEIFQVEPAEAPPRRATAPPAGAEDLRAYRQRAEESLRQEFERRQLALLARCLLPVAGLFLVKLGIQPETYNQWYAEHEAQVLTVLSAAITYLWHRRSVRQHVGQLGVSMWMNPVRETEEGPRPINVGDVREMHALHQQRRRGPRSGPGLLLLCVLLGQACAVCPHGLV